MSMPTSVGPGRNEIYFRVYHKNPQNDSFDGEAVGIHFLSNSYFVTPRNGKLVFWAPFPAGSAGSGQHQVEQTIGKLNHGKS